MLKNINYINHLKLILNKIKIVFRIKKSSNWFIMNHNWADYFQKKTYKKYK